MIKTSQYISVNHEHIFPEYVPFLFDDSFSQYYFNYSIKVDDQDFVRKIFINHLDTNSPVQYQPPAGWIVYDYYATGEFYLDMELNNLRYLAADHIAMAAFSYVIASFNEPISHAIHPDFFDPNDEEFSEIIVLVNDPNATTPVWYINIENIFSTQPLTVDTLAISKSYSGATKKDIICKYYTNTINSSNCSNVVSNEYNFANNNIPLPICSHPNFQNSFASCHFPNENCSCPIYKPSVKFISKVSVKLSNSSVENIFSLKENKTFYNTPVYTIVNELTNSILHDISIPDSSISEEEIKEHVSNVFVEFLSPYENNELTNLPIDSSPSADKKTGLIHSLLV